jgi:hypothetical protein
VITPAAAGALTLVAPAAADAHLTRHSKLTTAGLGFLKIGMTIRQAELAVGYPIRPVRLSPEDRCFTARIRPRRFGVSVLGTGRRIRVIYLEKRALSTRSGIRVGDRVTKLRSTYGSKLVVKRNFYHPAWRQYEIHDGNYKVVFLTNNRKVTSISAGRKPEVDYVEACA